MAGFCQVRQHAYLALKPSSVRCSVWMSCQPAACSRQASTLMCLSTGCAVHTQKKAVRGLCAWYACTLIVRLQHAGGHHEVLPGCEEQLWKEVRCHPCSAT